MPYCRKCGVELDPDSKFCHDCGTQITSAAPAPAQAATLEGRKKFPLAAVILISILIVAFSISALFFLPFNPVSFSKSDEVSSPNISMLNLVLNGDIANVNVQFKNLPEAQRAAVNVSATGSQGIFAPEQPVTLTSTKETTGSALTYTVDISRTVRWNLFFNIVVSCEVYIDPTADLNLAIQTGTGNIILNADQPLNLRNLRLETTTGNIDATLAERTVVINRVDIKTSTGSSHLHWDQASAHGDISVSLKATTGTVQATINQNKQLSGNITYAAETTTGAVLFAIDISDGVAARIEAETVLGGVSVGQTGFSGDEVPLQSENYPSQSNFDASLRATTGRIEICANYETGIRS